MNTFAERRTMMVDTQVRPSDVTKFPIIEAMLSVPKEDFVPDHMKDIAYLSENLAIAAGRIILEPRTFGKMLDALNPQPDELILDVACGLGYSTALLARLCDTVVALEDDADRVQEAQKLLSGHGFDNAAVIEGELAQGAPKHGPYDAILINGGVARLPEAYPDQLKDGGRIACVFMEGELGTCRIAYKVDGYLNWRFAFNAAAPVLAGFEAEAAFAL